MRSRSQPPVAPWREKLQDSRCLGGPKDQDEDSWGDAWRGSGSQPRGSRGWEDNTKHKGEESWEQWGHTKSKYKDEESWGAPREQWDHTSPSSRGRSWWEDNTKYKGEESWGAPQEPAQEDASWDAHHKGDASWGESWQPQEDASWKHKGDASWGAPHHKGDASWHDDVPHKKNKIAHHKHVRFEHAAEQQEPSAEPLPEPVPVTLTTSKAAPPAPPMAQALPLEQLDQALAQIAAALMQVGATPTATMRPAATTPPAATMPPAAMMPPAATTPPEVHPGDISPLTPPHQQPAHPQHANPPFVPMTPAWGQPAHPAPRALSWLQQPDPSLAPDASPLLSPGAGLRPRACDFANQGDRLCSQIATTKWKGGKNKKQHHVCAYCRECLQIQSDSSRARGSDAQAVAISRTTETSSSAVASSSAATSSARNIIDVFELLSAHHPGRSPSPTPSR